MIPVHKKNLTALRSVELFSQPIASLLRDVAAGNNDCMINKHSFVNLWVKYYVSKHHSDLSQHFRNGIQLFGDASNLPFFTCTPKYRLCNVGSWNFIQMSLPYSSALSL